MNMNMNPNSELVQSAVNVPNLVQVPDALISQAREFQQAMMMYTCAIREVKTKLEVLNDELSIKNQRNPIEMIKSRVKKPISIVEKLQRRNLPVTLESMMNNLDDVAGIRVICSFVDDIYCVANMLVSQDDITVIAIKDYIKNPKPNGYRSYHLIIEIPVFFSEEKKNLRVEVQIRTIAMDFWASLEHKIAYKFEGNAPDYLEAELKACADVVDMLDAKMFSLNHAIMEIGERQRKEEERRIQLEENRKRAQELAERELQ